MGETERGGEREWLRGEKRPRGREKEGGEGEERERRREREGEGEIKRQGKEIKGEGERCEMQHSKQNEAGWTREGRVSRRESVSPLRWVASYRIRAPSTVHRPHLVRY